MINASSQFKEQVKNGAKFVNYADITLKDGTVLNLGPSDFVVGAFSMEDKTTTGKFGVGSAVGKTINITIANHTNKFSEYDFHKAIIYMYVAVELEDGTVSQEKKGKYYVINPASPGDTIKISGVDSMWLFDKPYESDIPFPATLQTILSTCCTDCGVNIGFGQFDNWDFVVYGRPEGATYREVVSYVAQIAGYNARINNNDYLELVWYENATAESEVIDGGNYYLYESKEIYDGGDFTTYESDNLIDGGLFTDVMPENISKVKNLSVSTDDVVITGVKVDFDKVSELSGEEGYVINVKNNPFTEGAEKEIADYLAKRLVGLKFRPLSLQTTNNPLIEPYDSFYVYDRKGNAYFTLINSVQYTISGFTSLACSADDPVRNESHYLSEYAKAIVQARRNAETLSKEAQIAAEKNAEYKAAEIASEKANEAYEAAEKKAQELSEAAQKASGEEAAKLAEAAQKAAEEAAQLKADAAKSAAIAEAAREAAELANKALEESQKYTDNKITIYDNAVQNMNMLAANSMGLYRESERQADGSTIYYMSNRPIVKDENGICEFEINSVVYKMTGDGFFVSEDGGLSYTSGFDSEGNAVVNVLSAIGITFDWARGGTLSLGGIDNRNGVLIINDKNGNQIGAWTNNKFYAMSPDYTPEEYPNDVSFDVIATNIMGSYLHTTQFKVNDSTPITIDLIDSSLHTIKITCVDSSTYGDSATDYISSEILLTIEGKQVVIENSSLPYRTNAIKRIYVDNSEIIGISTQTTEYRTQPIKKSEGQILNFEDGTLKIGNISLGDYIYINNKKMFSSEIIKNSKLSASSSNGTPTSVSIDIPLNDLKQYSFVRVSASGNDIVVAPFSAMNPFDIVNNQMNSSGLRYKIQSASDTFGVIDLTISTKIIDAERYVNFSVSQRSTSTSFETSEKTIYIIGIV